MCLTGIGHLGSWQKRNTLCCVRGTVLEHSLLCWEYSFVTVRYVHCCKVYDCIIGVIWYSFVFCGLFTLGW